MFKNWSKIVLVSMLIVVVAASMSFATTARVRSLANTGDYMSDDSNVNRWISTLPSYANQVTGEIGTHSGSLGDSQGLSWNFSTGKYGTYRITLNEAELNDPGFWMINPFYANLMPGGDATSNLGAPGTIGTNTPVNTFDLAGGWEIGESMAIGVNLTTSRWSYENNDTTAIREHKSSWTSIGGGFSWTNNEDMMLDAVLNLGFASGSFQTNTAPKYEYDSSTAFDIAGRFMWDWKDNITVPVVAEYLQSDYSWKFGNQVSPTGDKINGFMLGAGVNMDVNDDHMLIFAAEYMQNTWKYSKEHSTSDQANPDSLAEVSTRELPTLRLALESSITSWLTTRIGASRSLTTQTIKSNNGTEVKRTEDVNAPGLPPFAGVIDDLDPFNWYLGVGFNVAEWTIDMELNHEAPFSIGYWLTGYSAYFNGGTGPVYRITALYNY
jgi:hypothetical protein